MDGNFPSKPFPTESAGFRLDGNCPSKIFPAESVEFWSGWKLWGRGVGVGGWVAECVCGWVGGLRNSVRRTTYRPEIRKSMGDRRRISQQAFPKQKGTQTSPAHLNVHSRSMLDLCVHVSLVEAEARNALSSLVSPHLNSCRSNLFAVTRSVGGADTAGRPFRKLTMGHLMARSRQWAAVEWRLQGSASATCTLHAPADL